MSEMMDRYLSLAKQTLGVSELPEGFEELFTKFLTYKDRLDGGIPTAQSLALLFVMGTEFLRRIKGEDRAEIPVENVEPTEAWQEVPFGSLVRAMKDGQEISGSFKRRQKVPKKNAYSIVLEVEGKEVFVKQEEVIPNG